MINKRNNSFKYIRLKPVEMTSEIMQMLEGKGLIYRLCPGHDELRASKEETLVKTIYASDEKFGPHKLITVTVNRSEFAVFHTHPDSEEFLAIGDPNAKPLYLVMALCNKHELESRVKSKTLSENDFVTLKVKYNDPEVSFFTILKNIPHGEAASAKDGKPPSFYVTESRDLGVEMLLLGEYKLKLEEDYILT